MSALLESGTRKRDVGGARAGAPPALPSSDRLRELLRVAFVPAAVVLSVVAVLVLLALVLAGSDLTGVPGAIAAGWLAVHQVPLTIGTTALAVLPVLPTVAMGWLTARGCAHATSADSDRAEVYWVLGAAIGGPLLVTVVSLAVVKDASAVIALAPPDTLLAFGWVILVQGAAAAGGVASRTWRQVVGATLAPDWLITGLAVAGRAAVHLLLAGTALTVLGMAFAWSTVADSMHTADGFVGGLGMLVLSLGYLPNVAVASAAVLVGARASIGDASISLFSVTGGPVPGVPVLAGVPTGPAAAWWPMLLLVPAAIAVAAGRRCAAGSVSRADAIRAALVAAAALGVVALLAGAVCGGALGTFGHIGVSAWMFAGLALAWAAVVGSASAVLATRGRSAVRLRRADIPPEPEPEPEAVVDPEPDVEAATDDVSEPDEDKLTLPDDDSPEDR